MQLGLATTYFMRATLGFEKEVMEKAGARIAEAEDSAYEHQRRAQHNPSTSNQSGIYPVGSEYALVYAETQLMSAVVAVLTESLTESLKGFYKLRKAFATLHEISEAEKKFLRAHCKKDQSGTSSVFSSSAVSVVSGIGDTKTSSQKKNLDEEDDDMEFVDASDGGIDVPTPMAYQGHMEYLSLSDLKLNDSSPQNLVQNPTSALEPGGLEADSKSTLKHADEDIDLRDLTSDPIDLFIHSGTNLCFGLLQLLLSMIPPAFAKILSIFSFRGDRETGLKMLWLATRFKDNINGAMAGMIVLGFHNAALAFCDIISKDALPTDRLRALLKELRGAYPKSKLWLLEEARMLSADRKLDDATRLIVNGRQSSLKQIEALGVFELSLSYMYLHRYQDCADSFLRCIGMNNWSHALYYYIAGACNVEMYRDLRDSDPEKAKAHAAKAEQHLHEVLSHAGKKRFMARQLPFDVFVTRKIAKWDARAKARGCSFVDAVGVSPVVEMTYFWSGFRRMGEKHLRVSLDRLNWSEEQPGWEKEPADEKAVLAFLKGTCQRFQGNLEQAQTIFTEQVFSYELAQLKMCDHADSWPLPVAHYEMAVCYFVASDTAAKGENRDATQLRKCNEELSKVERWESYDLEARIGMKITTARETLRRNGIRAAV